MRRGVGREHGRLIIVAVLVVVTGLAMVVVGGCGDAETQSITTATTAASSESPAGGGAAEDEGAAVAEEILATYDEIIAKVADLVKDKPDPAAVTPQLEELYASYEPKMAELNTKYLALRDGDVASWGAANTYLGSNRGPRITAAENTLVEAIKHYNLNLGDQEMVSLITSRPVDLLEMAVNQGQ